MKGRSMARSGNGLARTAWKGHPRITRIKPLAKMFVQWPGIDKDIEECVQHVCLAGVSNYKFWLISDVSSDQPHLWPRLGQEVPGTDQSVTELSADDSTPEAMQLTNLYQRGQRLVLRVYWIQTHQSCIQQYHRISAYLHLIQPCPHFAELHHHSSVIHGEKGLLLMGIVHDYTLRS